MEFNFERDVYMYGEVNCDSVFRVIERLNLLNRYDEEMLKNGPRNYKAQPIVLHINSGGGSVYDGIALYSAIKNSPTPVMTIGSGMVGSAALLIFLGGKYRVAYPYTTFLYHSPKWGVLNSTPYQVKNFNDYYERMHKQLIEIIKKESDLSDAIINKVRKEDFQLYMSPEQAMSVGICDMIYDLEAMAAKNKKNDDANKEIIEMIKKMAEEAKADDEKKTSEECSESNEKVEEKKEEVEKVNEGKEKETTDTERVGNLVKTKTVEESNQEKNVDLDELNRKLNEIKKDENLCDCDNCKKIRNK